MSKERIISAAIEKYVDKNGGFDFYAARVDRGATRISNDGKVTLYRKGSHEKIASYHVDELDFPGKEQKIQVGQADVQQDSDDDFVSIELTDDPRKVIGLIASAILIVGTLSPIVTLPAIGSINYVHDGRGDGVLIIAIGVASAFLSLSSRYTQLRGTGFSSLVIIFTTLHILQLRLHDIKTSIEEDLSGNPFRGLADAAITSIRLEWGWILLIGSSITLIAVSTVVSTDKGQRLPRKAIGLNIRGFKHSIPLLVAGSAVLGLALAQLIHTSRILDS